MTVVPNAVSNRCPLRPKLNRRHLFGIAAGTALAAGRGVRPAFAQTPAPEGAAPLLDLLACVPASFLDQAGDTAPSWYYDDLKQQVDAFGIAPDFSNGMPDGFFVVMQPLRTDSIVFDYALMTDITDALGFQPLAAHQVLSMGPSDQRLTLFRGGIDLDTLPAAWEAAGYTLAQADSGQEIWTLGGPADFDFNHPIQGAMISEFNNVTILDGGILAYASDLAILDRAAATRMARTGSVANDPAHRAILASVPAATVSCYAVPGALLNIAHWDGDTQSQWANGLAESDAAVGPMPSLAAMIIGVTVGLLLDDPESTAPSMLPDTDGTAFARIATASAADAGLVGKVVEHRWTTADSVTSRTPFTDFMAIEGVGTEGAIATIDFAPVASPVAWRDLVPTGDVFPFIFNAP